MAAEPHRISHLIHGHVVLFEPLPGVVQAYEANEQRGRPVRQRPDLAVQLRAAELEFFGQFFHPKGFILQVFFDDLLDPLLHELGRMELQQIHKLINAKARLTNDST